MTKYYFVQIPEENLVITWIGGDLLPAEPGHVWLTTPENKPVRKVRSECVQPSTREETARRMAQDRRLNQ